MSRIHKIAELKCLIDLDEQLYTVFAANAPETLIEAIPVLCTFIEYVSEW